jgi:hypothetical protein
MPVCGGGIAIPVPGRPATIAVEAARGGSELRSRQRQQ